MASTIQCPSCGAALVAGAAKCAYCGADAPVAVLPAQPAGPNPPQSQPPKRSNARIGLGLLAFFLLTCIGHAMSWFGVVLGSLGVAGCCIAMMRGTRGMSTESRKTWMGGAGKPWVSATLACILLGIGGLTGGGGEADEHEKVAAQQRKAKADEEAKAKAAADAARQAKEQADRAKAEHDALLATIAADAASGDMAAACEKLDSTGGIPQPQQKTCAAAVAAEKRQEEAEEKKRLAARKFIYATPDAMATQLGGSNDPEEMFGASYEGKYVRWQGKFERKGIIVKFIASTGEWTSFSCKDFDPAHDETKFALDDIAPWARVSVEGRLDGIQKQLGKNKTEFVLTECIAKKL